MALNLVSYLQAYTICFSPITHYETKRLMNLLYFILLGALAGWLAGQIMKGSGYGAIVNIILGIVGGLVGGWLFGQLGVSAGGGLVGSLITATVGAVVVIFVAGLLRK